MAVQTQQNQPQQQQNQLADEIPPTNIPLKPKRKTALIIALVLLFLLMVGGLAYLAFQNYQLRREISKLGRVNGGNQEESEEVYLGWKTYKSEIEGYSFRIPDNWDTHSLGNTLMVAPQEEVEEVKAKQGGFGGGKFLTLTVSDYILGHPILTLSQTQEDEDIVEKEMVLGGKQADVFQRTLKESVPGFSVGDVITTVVVENDGRALKIDLLDLQYEEIFDKILSSFQFISKNGWKGYTSQTPKFIIDYPNNWEVTEIGNNVGFGPAGISEDQIWGVNYYKDTEKSVDQIMNEAGSQFSDKQQTSEELSIYGGTLPATKVITTTPSNPDWYLVQVVIEAGDYTYVISNGALTDSALNSILDQTSNGGIDFERFYSTFETI